MSGTDVRLEIRPATSDEDLATLVDLVVRTTPDDPTSLEEIRWSDRTYPGTSRVLAELDGRAVGAATVGRMYVYPPEYPDLWGSIAVLPGARRRGTGGALLEALSEHARGAGKTGLQMRTSVARPEGIEFLAKRGFTELERARMVRLELDGLAAPALDLPEGISLVTLAERPDLVSGVHLVAVESFVDIPGGDDPIVAGDLAEFQARDVDRPGIPSGAFMIALHTVTGAVIGYASLMLIPGSTTVAWHDMTAVLRAWRGRGIAVALKRATIGWAIRNGLTALETGNDEDNAPMRAVNARLGYQPLPDEVTMRGPVMMRGPVGRRRARAGVSGHHAVVTEPTPSPDAAHPPDPAAYDSPRAVRAREKGLPGPYIAGGADPDPAPGLAEERRLGKLLVAMAVVIVASGFVIGIITAVLGPAGGR